MRAWTPIVGLGLVTITSYGSWFYAYGVLIDPIAADTGWSQTTLGAIFAAAQLISGLGATAGGRLLDRLGARAVFLVLAVAGAGPMMLSSVMPGAFGFGVGWSIGAGVTGALGFYHVTTATAARVGPSTPASSIAVLTIIGALASPIYIPTTAWLVTRIDWRPTVRLLAILVAAGALVAAQSIPPGTERRHGETPSQSGAAAIRLAIQSSAVRHMLLAVFASGIAYGIVLVYQVPIMVAAGLSLTTAATVAGARGFFQLGGRIGLGKVVAKTGARPALVWAYGMALVGSLLLLASGRLAAAIGFAVLAGVSLGAVSPLQAIYGEELYEAADLGTLLGVQQGLIGIGGALGPLAAGILVDSTGSHTISVLVAAGGLAVAIVVLASSRTPGRVRSDR